MTGKADITILKPWDAKDRVSCLKELAGTEYDVLVVGGGGAREPLAITSVVFKKP